MKSFRLASLLAVAVTALLSASVLACVNSHQDGEFSVKQYNDFHDLLRPLQHEALPKKEFARIREKATDLALLGDAIVQLDVPAGVREAKAEEFKQGLKRFDDALKKFSADAKKGSDEQLAGSFASVHDSFETLADMLPPRK